MLSVDVMNMFLLCYIQWQTHLYIHLYLLTVFPRSANILFIKWSFDLRRNWQRRYRPCHTKNISMIYCQRVRSLENTLNAIKNHILFSAANFEEVYLWHLTVNSKFLSTYQAIWHPYLLKHYLYCISILLRNLVI